MTSPPTRRHVLIGGAAAAGLAGCTTPSPAPPPAPQAPASTAPADQPGAVGSAGTSVAAAADVPVGGALVVEALELVVTQPSAPFRHCGSRSMTNSGLCAERSRPR